MIIANVRTSETKFYLTFNEEIPEKVRQICQRHGTEYYPGCWEFPRKAEICLAFVMADNGVIFCHTAKSPSLNKPALNEVKSNNPLTKDLRFRDELIGLFGELPKKLYYGNKTKGSYLKNFYGNKTNEFD